MCKSEAARLERFAAAAATKSRSGLWWKRAERHEDYNLRAALSLMWMETM